MNNLPSTSTFKLIINSLKDYFKDEYSKIIELIKGEKFKDRFLLNLEKIASKTNNYHLSLNEVKILKKPITYSPFLTEIILKNPDYFLNFLFKNHNYKKISTLKHYKKALKNFIKNIPRNDLKKFMKFLRYFKQREFLKIGIQDINMLYSFPIIARQITYLAIAICDITSEWLWNYLNINSKTNYIILGMGKIGGYELNYSSDIDLIYFTTSEPENYEIFRNFFELFTKALNEVTEDGFVFRVDLRLRPDGISGPLFISIKSALNYYENWGKTWERGALLKAIPIAGDINAGEKLLIELEPFIYRKSIDFQVINDIKEIKRKINLETKNKENNIKLGKGGIREIEFIMQAIQLMYGGKDKSLREKNLIRFFEILKTKNLKILTEDEINTLIKSYIFLRNVEHKIQIYQEKQTQVLPKNKENLELLSYAMGYSNTREFLNDLNFYRENVYKIFDNFFKFEEREKDYRFHEIVELIEIGDEKRAINSLKDMCFKNPERSLNILKTIIFNHKIPLTQNELNEVKTLISNFLNSVKNIKNKDDCLINFENLIEKIIKKTGYINFLNENPEILNSLLNIFSESRYLSELLLKYSDIFEELFISNFILQEKNIEDYFTELDEFLKKGKDYEDFIELIRIFTHKETIRIGIKFLNKSYSLLDTVHHLTSLADAIFTKSVAIVLEEFRKRFGKIASDFTIIALGKYGGYELNFSSDLDIILIFEKDTVSTNGYTSIEYFSKFLQRLISFLSITTRNGKAYEIDTRLRPSGNAGALVCSFSSFKDYHLKKQPEIWEMQALLKTRTVIGDNKVENFIKNLIASFELNESHVKEMLRIRKRIEDEEGKENLNTINIKSGKGGIIDIEFLTQILMLKNKIIEPNTFKALKFTIPELYSHYYKLREVENLIRLKNNKHTDFIKREDFPEIVKIKEEVREIFNKKVEELV